MTRYYPALIEGNDQTGYGVTFPDFPGCTSAGTTVELAVANAAEALLFHLEGMIEDGDAIPEPSPLDAPLPNWLEGTPGVHVLVPVKPPGKAIRVNITMDEHLLARVDRAAAAHQDTRSGFLAKLAHKGLRDLAA